MQAKRAASDIDSLPASESECMYVGTYVCKCVIKTVCMCV